MNNKGVVLTVTEHVSGKKYRSPKVIPFSTWRECMTWYNDNVELFTSKKYMFYSIVGSIK